MLQSRNLDIEMKAQNRTNSTNLVSGPKFCLFFLFLILFRHGFGQETLSKIDKKDLKSFIKTLSSNQFSGRGLDNDGQIKTQEFIINRFKELQLEPFSHGNYLEKFSLYQISRGEIYVKTQNNQKLRNFDRMMFNGGISQYGEMVREVVFGGYGTEEELDQIEVENRFVLIALTNPKEEMNLKKRLEKRHANGLIVFRNDDQHFESTKRRLKEFHTTKKYSIVGSSDTMVFPTLAEILKDLPTINSIDIPGAEVGNIMGRSKNELVNLAKKKKIDAVPPVVLTINFERVRKTVETANVVGIIRGESEKSIVISAHYDHLGKDEKHYYPGADDNASGVAAMLELAEEFAQYRNLKYSMIFLATSAEEGGLLGARYHVGKADFDPDQIICNFNIDMISRCDNRQPDCKYLYVLGSNQSGMLDSLVRTANTNFSQITFKYENDPDILGRSDGHNFQKKGVPSIMFFSGFHDDYHKPTDTMEKINFNILENRIKLISEVLKLLQE